MTIARLTTYCTILANLLSFAQAQQTNQPTRLPEVAVSGSATPSDLREEALVGENQQPLWTTHRRFATTRIYVLPPWEVEFEQWWKGKFPRHGGPSHQFQSEIGVGLPYRFQLDLYENLQKSAGRGFRHQGNQVELRYALAEWGKIPLNPTVYGEWKFNHSAPDAYEVKVLLGEEFASRWHWGLNVFYEQEVGGGRDSEMGFAQALSYTAIDEKLGLGLEMKMERASAPNYRGKPTVEFLLGPSLQWRPASRVHVDLVPLFGLTHDSPKVEAYVVVGIDLGPKKSEDRGVNPASSRSR
jgi:hypothetical protein